MIMPRMNDPGDGSQPIDPAHRPGRGSACTTKTQPHGVNSAAELACKEALLLPQPILCLFTV